MTVLAFQLQTSFVSAGECCRVGCGLPIALPRQVYEECRHSRPRPSFYCARGHGQYFVEETESEAFARMTREQAEEHARALAFEKNRREDVERRLETTKKQAAAYKGKVTLFKNRVGNGVCPCCNRTFQNLLKHMHTQHPEFRDENNGE